MKKSRNIESSELAAASSLHYAAITTGAVSGAFRRPAVSAFASHSASHNASSALQTASKGVVGAADALQTALRAAQDAVKVAAHASTAAHTIKDTSK